MELKDYTTEELKAEINRRNKEKLRELAKKRKGKAEYEYLEAEVVYVSDEPYLRRQFHIKLDETDVVKYNMQLSYKHGMNTKIDRGNFKRDTAPRVGDIVKIKCRKTIAYPNGFGLFCSPIIIEIVKRANNQANGNHTSK